MSEYDVLKFAHILLAIVAVGFNASYAIWLARVAREPAHGLHVLRGIKTLDDRFANPAYALLLLTGLGMVVVARLELTTFWLAASLVLYVALVIVGLGLYTPLLRRQISAFEALGAASDEYRRLATRATVIGIVLAVLAVSIVFLMVVKPTI